MLNLVGNDGFEGNVFYENLHEAFNEENTHLHIYGKEKTRANKVHLLGRKLNKLIFRN